MFQKYLFLLVLLISSQIYSQKIDNIKKDLNQEVTKLNSSKSDYKSSSSSSENLGIALIEIFSYLGIYATYGIVVGSYGQEDHLHNRLSKYPFFDNKSGNYVASDSIGKKVRLDAETNYLFESNRISALNFNLKFYPSRYFYFQAMHTSLRESSRIDNLISNLNLLNVSLCYDRIRTEKFNLGWNVGVLHLGSGINQSSISLGMNTSFFPAKKVSFEASGKWSFVSVAPIRLYEIKGKYHIDKSYLTVGYHNYKIGSSVFNLAGIGVGFYF